MYRNLEKINSWTEKLKRKLILVWSLNVAAIFATPSRNLAYKNFKILQRINIEIKNILIKNF